MAGKRREGRILAAQFLYQREVGISSIPLDEALKNLWEQTEAVPEACAFAEKRIRAVLEKQTEVDAELKKLVTNWDPNRMAPVDRAILRLALWEMKFADDVPPISALNEAIEVAKALSTPAIKEKLLSQGAIPGGNTPEEFAKFIDAEHKKWAQVVKASGAKVD